MFVKNKIVVTGGGGRFAQSLKNQNFIMIRRGIIKHETRHNVWSKGKRDNSL